MQSWQSMTDKFESLNKRERWLVFGASLFVAYALINALFLSPLLAKKKILANEISADQAQVQALQQQIVVMNSQAPIDPDAANKQRIATLQLNLQQIESQLGNMQASLISPEKMPELLRSLLKKNGKLKLVELKTLPPQSLVENIASDSSLNTAAIQTTAQTNIPTPAKTSPFQSVGFKHGVEITVEGRYLDLLAYVSDLERTSWHILWSKAELNTAHYPSSQLKLTVYTLSLDQAWLSIW